jgi:hypothetical protein
MAVQGDKGWASPTMAPEAFDSSKGYAYWQCVSAEIPRFLSWQDREPLSKTYGCFDRVYWAWKFTDFPGARFQEGVYALAHLFTRPLPGNPLAGDPRALEWIRAGLVFWQLIQYRDGSFDEAYPFERSLAATAFTGFCVGEALLCLGDQLTSNERESLERSLTRAADWLCRNDERHGVLSNHLAAAAASLYVIFRLTGEDRFERRCWQYIQRIYDHQSEEGWYEEYGGADPGYQTHCTFYLARLWQYTKDATLLKSLERSVSFLKHFIHPNGSLGGEYGSRNTEFYIPAGIEILAPVVSDAAQIAQFMRPMITKRRMVGIWTMDSYNFLPMLNSYLIAEEHISPLTGSGENLPCLSEGEWLFPDAGLYVRSTESYYAAFGLSKGGVFKLYDRSTGRLAVSDCGYWARVGGGQVASSQSLQRPSHWRRDNGDFCITTDFVMVNQRVQSPLLFILFRAFSITFGRIQAVAYLLKGLLVKVLMQRRRSVPLRLKRRIRLTARGVCISDELTLFGPLRVDLLRRGTKFSTIHMGSSRYFQQAELEVPPDDARNWAGDLRRNRALRFDWSWAPVTAERATNQ